MITEIIVHPFTASDMEEWTHTFVFDGGSSSTAVAGKHWKERGYEKPTQERAVKRALEMAEKMWKVKDPEDLLEIQDEPYKAPAVAREVMVKAVKGELPIYIDTADGPRRLSAPDPEVPAPPIKSAKPEIAVTETSPYYTNPCVVCGKPILKTGKRGRPPVRHQECVS